ncbi:MAG: hypothetical protein ABI835_18315 [Chloroflexota bacterium]
MAAARTERRLVCRARDLAIMVGMKKLMLLIALLLAGCGGAPTPVVEIIPTLAVLPTRLPSVTLSVVPSETASSVPPSATATASSTATLAASDTLPPAGSVTAVMTSTGTPSETYTPSATLSLTPSLTITNTITPTPSQTFTPMPDLDGIGMLALLLGRATVLPPEQLYNPPTLTAVAFAAQTLIAGGGALSPTPVSGVPDAGSTLPPVNCASPPPASLTSADPSLTGFVGCPLGATFTTTTAVQSFERGSMLYIQGSPNSIYVLTLDGRFRRYEDTWISGVDPETGGETPPLGLIEPKRGFGKVWRLNLDARGALGWGVNEEQGATSSALLFERGRAIFLPQRGETYVLSDDPGGQSGSWRTVPASF